jgi:hypothetical protein
MAEALAVPRSSPRWFVPGDGDGFFALFFSGFPDLLLIAALAPLCGFPPSAITTWILPGVALSIIAGNIFYAWQATRPTANEARTGMPLPSCWIAHFSPQRHGFLQQLHFSASA